MLERITRSLKVKSRTVTKNNICIASSALAIKNRGDTQKQRKEEIIKKLIKHVSDMYCHNVHLDRESSWAKMATEGIVIFCVLAISSKMASDLPFSRAPSLS